MAYVHDAESSTDRTARRSATTAGTATPVRPSRRSPARDWGFVPLLPDGRSGPSRTRTPALTCDECPTQRRLARTQPARTGPLVPRAPPAWVEHEARDSVRHSSRFATARTAKLGIRSMPAHGGHRCGQPGRWLSRTRPGDCWAPDPGPPEQVRTPPRTVVPASRGGQLPRVEQGPGTLASGASVLSPREHPQYLANPAGAWPPVPRRARPRLGGGHVDVRIERWPGSRGSPAAGALQLRGGHHFEGRRSPDCPPRPRPAAVRRARRGPRARCTGRSGQAPRTGEPRRSCTGAAPPPRLVATALRTSRSALLGRRVHGSTISAWRCPAR